MGGVNGTVYPVHKFHNNFIVTTCLLAAGYAAWLYPLTENYPEPLWRRTVLDWLLSDVDGVDVVMKYRQVANG